MDLLLTIAKVCEDYQEESFNGRWHISHYGLKKVSKLLGGNYSTLTKRQRAVFRNHCIITAQGHISVKSWKYYLNLD